MPDCLEFKAGQFIKYELIPWEVEHSHAAANVGAHSLVWPHTLPLGAKMIELGVNIDIYGVTETQKIFGSEVVKKGTAYKWNWTDLKTHLRRVYQACDDTSYFQPSLSGEVSDKLNLFSGPYDISPDGTQAIYRWFPDYVVATINITDRTLITEKRLPIEDGLIGSEPANRGKVHFRQDGNVYAYKIDRQTDIIEQTSNLFTRARNEPSHEFTHVRKTTEFIRYGGGGEVVVAGFEWETRHTIDITYDPSNQNAFNPDTSITQTAITLTYPGGSLFYSTTVTVDHINNVTTTTGTKPNGWFDSANVDYPTSSGESFQGTTGCIRIEDGLHKSLFYVTPDQTIKYPSDAHQANHNRVTKILSFDTDKGRWQSEFVAP